MKRLKAFIIIVIIMFTVINVAWANKTFDVKVLYEVQEGDALINIAREFGVSPADIKAENDLVNSHSIRVGDELLIPRQYTLKEPANENFYALHQPELGIEEFSLRNGDSYEVRIKNKQEYIPVDVSNLETLDYQIRRGDNLYDLAREFNTSINIIRELNDLRSSDIIRLGDKIKLPINNLTSREVLSYTIKDEEFEMLARIIHGEARGETITGQIAVGAVVLNRVLDSYFPDSIEEVIYQPRQFSPVFDGQINLTPNRNAYRAAEAALNGEDPTRGAIYFYNPDTANYISWFQTREFVVRIGDHIFAR